MGDEIKTSDIYLASVLSLYFPVERIEKTGTREDGRKPYSKFVFIASEDSKNAMSLYYQGNLTIDPKAVFAAFDQMKRKLFDV